MKKQLLYLLAGVFFLASCSKKDDPAPTPTPEPTPTPYVADNSFKIVAYMPSYQDPGTILDNKYKMITHLFYAFLSPSAAADGSLQSLPQSGRFAAVKAKCKTYNVKFGISIGPGAADISENTFLVIAQTPSARANFVKNIVAFAKNNDLDGVDMDWEYPRDNNGGSQAFHSLMQELSTELHKIGKYLSAAVTPAVYTSSNRMAILQQTYQYVDFFNIMQYDGAGYDSAEPLNHASYKMTVASLDYWLGTRALPKEKAILGMPCYGKSATGGALSYKSIEVAAAGNANVNVATVNGVQYGYNGIPTIKQKTQLAKERANGIMFWEFAQDTNNDNSLIKAANDQLGRSY
ncbi:glycosyl hydrolase family 18 protein [Nubsella zeaxanthinifaciens]|uniref:glycosyl hydrolase family 18 protein n=1 Tax=Nubsella zeaxanthinifaciens TaxID=392412 RepID=UPI000DE291AA|nr:glycosyl hydrolase family 18 protein [Nubsella zeaxanthinifaciens]